MSPVKISILLSVLVLIVSPCNKLHAQNRTIHGKVINSKTNAPVSGAKVSVLGTDEKVVTNLLGEYSFKVMDTLKKVIFSGIEGMSLMETKTISEDEVDVYVSETDFGGLSIEELMKIKITTAGKKEQVVSDIPASVIVITRADIEAYGYQSLIEILSNTLGMYKIDDYRTTGFGVRGFFSNVYNRNIVFMINGVKQQTPYLNWNELNLMNIQVETIERIECVRGPVAIIYGNDAFFGAINIITHENGKQTKSSVTSAYGTNNSYRGNLQVNSANENTTMNLSAGYYHTDGRDVPFNKILDSVQSYNTTWIKNGTSKDYFIQNSSYINLSVAHNGFYSNLSFDQSNRNLIQFFAPVYDTSKINRKDQILRGRLGYRKSLNKYFSLDVNTNFQNCLIDNYYRKIVAQPNVNFGYDQFEMQKMDVEGILFINPTQNFHITLGANYSNLSRGYDFTDVPAVGANREEERLNTPCISYGSFLQAEYEFFHKFRLLAGIRIDKQDPYEYKNTRFVGVNYEDTFYTYSYNKTLYIPRIALVYNINKFNSLKVMYSEAISRPGAYENSFISWDIHPQLIPQKISTSEFNYSSSLFSNFNMNVNVFYNELTDLINRRTITTTSTFSVVTENNNSGKLSTLGGELQLIYQPIANLKFDLSMSYQQTRNQTFGNAAAYSPNILGYLKIIYSLKKNILIGLNSYYVGSMESEWNEAPVDPANGNFTAKGRISETTPAYFNLGLNLRFNNILNKGLYFSVHATNLLNSDIFYAPTYVNSSYLPNGTVDAGIQLNAVLGIKF